jgi:hypothetical protein
VELEHISASITRTVAGSQIRKQEAECEEAIEMAFAPEPSTRFGAKSAMNTEAFPFEFLQKYFPKLARVEPTFVDSTAAEDGSMHTDVAILSATPGFTNEPRIVEIVLRIKVDGPRLGFLDTHNRDLQQLAATGATSPIR